uniref:Uncharacterized protein n=1 Tax=Nelumbo nucifera TaxID=4432 RepID=A0A822XIK5_NELNU|nr:TPA_asm: hypothetical protein HUJ06_021683 [Nelumbo nucifera]
MGANRSIYEANLWVGSKLTKLDSNRTVQLFKKRCIVLAPRTLSFFSSCADDLNLKEHGRITDGRTGTGGQ